MTAKDGWFFKAQLENFKHLGFKVTHKLLNAVNYGVPQTRKRMFIVGVRENLSFEYEFPIETHDTPTQPGLSLCDSIGNLPQWPKGEFIEKPFHGHYLTRNRKRAWDEPSYTIVAHAHHVPLHPSGEPMIFVKKDTWALQGKHNRRLSWRECAAIQCLPDGAFEGITKLESKYRVVGNAVPPTLGQILLEPIVKFERQKTRV